MGLNSTGLGATLCHLLNFAFGFSWESKEMVHMNVFGKLEGSGQPELSSLLYLHKRFGSGRCGSCVTMPLCEGVYVSPLRVLVWAGKGFLRINTGCRLCWLIIICFGGVLHLLARG